MSIYALFPLVAMIAYIPLLVTAVSSHHWHRRNTLFVIFLIAAMMWSLSDYLFRSNYFQEHIIFMGKLVITGFLTMAASFHVFTSSFFPGGRGRWLPFAYLACAGGILLIFFGNVSAGVEVLGDKLYPRYGLGILYIAAFGLILAARNFYVFGKTIKNLDNPVLYNQIISLIIGLAVLVLFAIVAILPIGREIPVSHFGNLVNAFVLSYAVVRHRLIDIRIVLRQGTALVALGLIGTVCYWLLIIFFHGIFDFELDLRAATFATLVAFLVGAFLYRLRGFFFTTMSRAFQGESYDYRWKLSDFANEIHNIFSLKKQGGELLELLTKAIGTKQACLLFPEIRGTDFTAQIIEPQEKDNPLAGFKIKKGNPILDYLSREKKLLLREDLSIKPEFLSLWEREKEKITAAAIEIFLPLISRDKLIAVLALGKKESGRYSLEDIHLLENVGNQVAVSIEKEYLREELREREEELSILNRTSSIITSSLNIQETFSNFIEELKKMADISWAAIILMEENGLHFLASAPETESPWHSGERIAAKGTFTEWVVQNKKPLIEPALSPESKFSSGRYLRQHGLQSLVYLPLMVKGEVIGSLAFASKKPDAYHRRHIMLFEQLAFQIAMPVENARLYAKVEEKARIDDLTGLLNRRSLDEIMVNETGRHSRYGGVFSLIILDLDNFKNFNDNYGHLAGDRLLKQIGGILKGAIRTADQAFRYGGDEFAILLPQTAIDAASQVAQRVRKHISLKVKTELVPITASLGIATWPADGITPYEIMAAADAALYQAKRSGGNRSHCASGTLLTLENLSEVSSKASVDDGILSTIYALAATVDARNPATIDHSKKVSEYALILAHGLKLPAKEKNRLEISALLHDIGKLGISDEILNKPAKLTEQEWAIIKNHPQLGAAVASRARQLSPCIAAILHHHEWWDGTGYPRGLKGTEIPLDARILAIADAFTAMTSNRPYATTMTQEEALAEVERGAGTQFDPHLARVFVTTIRNKEPLAQKQG